MADRRPPPFSLRLTFEERAKIEHDAAGMRRFTSPNMFSNSMSDGPVLALSAP